jgi:hypothetical protein
MQNMTPYVALQEQIIRWLFQELSEGEPFLREILARFRVPGYALTLEDVEQLVSRGLYFPVSTWNWESGLTHMQKAIVEIFLEQIDDSGPTIIIRNLLGAPLYNCGPTYDLSGWVEKRGSGCNRLRTTRFAQPGALQIHDRLVTGEEVISEPREGGNGTVYIHLSGRKNGTWLGVPACIPLALLTTADIVPGLIE